MPAPRSRTDLFLTFQRLALQGFGGVLAIAQHELVERKRWLSQEQFLEDWAVAQLLPGPNVVNLSVMIGARHFGWSGAVSAVSGMLIVPLLLLLALAAWVHSASQHPAIDGMLRGLGVAAAGLVIATSLRLTSALRGNIMGWFGCVGLLTSTLALVVGWRWPLVGVLLALGLPAMAWTWWQLQQQDR